MQIVVSESDSVRAGVARWRIGRDESSGDWKTVLRSIEAMSAAEQQAGVWCYWKARALKTKGRITEANALLAPLSSEHNFYGQLAEEEKCGV